MNFLKPKNYYLFYIILFFIFFASFFCLTVEKVFAIDLEVPYPDLATGSQLTSQTELPEYFKYVFDFGIFIGFFTVFLSLVWAGIIYLISPAMPDALAMAKDRATGAISGLLILATLYLIITTINPALSIFRIDELEGVPPLPEPGKEAGVYLYQERNCSPPTPQHPYTLSVPDLKDLTNRINAVDIVHDFQNQIYYLSILYDSPNFWGKCQYISPNSHCVQVNPFAVSVSIFQFDPNPRGEGVIFYRKSFYNDDGGWYKVKNSEIRTIGGNQFYIRKLADLKFRDPTMPDDENNPEKCTVPIEERDCVKWGNEGPIGACLERRCPTLAGENITSISINGNYIVLLIYYDISDPTQGPWSFCQAFPTKDDASKSGPKQIKWESVRNIDTGELPNWVMIIPVKQK